MMTLFFLLMGLLISLSGFFWGLSCFTLIFIMVMLMSIFPIFYDYSNYVFFVDILSFSLVFLSFWLFFLMIQSSFSFFEGGGTMGGLYLFLMVFLLFSLVFSFFSHNLLMFYFFFEVSLIPTLLMIMGWGYQPERLQASVYFLFYTLFGSLPLLMALFYLFSNSAAFYFSVLCCLNSVNFLGGVLFSVFLLLAFLIKMPMYLFHLWLPKAHVEAPVAGSMVLAGILLKLGGYGICRVVFLIQDFLFYISNYLVGLSLVSMVFVGVQCCRLNDLKALIAYSSVAHMGVVLGGLLTYFSWGFSGGLMLMVSHGIVSSGLFCIVNLYYERISSRSLFLNKGELLLIPGLGVFLFLLSVANIAAPPTINLLSEIFLMYSLISFSGYMMLFFSVGSFLGAVFTLFMFSFSQHGKNFSMMYGWLSMNSRECHLMLCHILPVNFLLMSSTNFLIF